MALLIDRLILELTFAKKIEDWDLIINKTFNKLIDLFHDKITFANNEKFYIELIQLVNFGIYALDNC